MQQTDDLSDTWHTSAMGKVSINIGSVQGLRPLVSHWYSWFLFPHNNTRKKQEINGSETSEYQIQGNNLKN